MGNTYTQASLSDLPASGRQEGGRSEMEAEFVRAWDSVAKEVYEVSAVHGFHGTPEQDNLPTKLMLVVSELAEAMEALRNKRYPGSDKIIGFTEWEEELADAVIRLMDLGAMTNSLLPEAIIAKHRYNATRSYRHGGKAF